MNRPNLDPSRTNSEAEEAITRIAMGDFAVGMLFPATATGYLMLVVGLSAIEIVALLLGFSTAVGVALFLTRGSNRAGSALGKWTTASRSAEDPAVGANVMLGLLQSLPVRRQRSFLLAGLGVVGLLPGVLQLVGDGGWFEWHRLQSLVIVSLASAALSSIMMFYWTRQRLASQRSAAGQDQQSDSMPGASYSLASRMQIVCALPAIAAILLMIDVTSQAHRAEQESAALVWGEQVVAAWAESRDEVSVDPQAREALPPEEFWPVKTQLFEIPPSESAETTPLGASKDLLAELKGQLADGLSEGLLMPARGQEIAAFKRTQDGTLLVAQLARRNSPGFAGAFDRRALIVACTLALFAAFLGRIVTSEIARSMDRLRDGANRLASGDLRGSSLDPTGDEFGALSNSIQLAGATFGETLKRTTTAAERVEAIVERLSGALNGIASASMGQAQKIDEANRLVHAVRGQMVEATRSAAQLTQAMDESSNSVLELGASGDELNETASVMTAKVDAVSTSLEQMVASVKQVGSTTGRLSEASEETSSSMEEMASAMRAVDTAAETTANLSRDVVEKAELGQRKVVQTIEGMEAIREATDVAERVIRGLGARTDEIGGILDVIEDVADETNLLALNAAIIAAQAGDQGKAFSVVADEIKELADRVLASTKEIGGLIRAVQEESENAIGAIEAGSASVMGGVDLSAEAGRTLEEITEASRESGTRITEIVNSVREQTKAASHVVTLMERVRESADQIGEAGAEQERGNEVVYRSALTMREVALQVRRTTEEQAAGFGQIRESVTGVRGAVEQITGVMNDQSDACQQVTGFLEGIAAGSRSNEGAAAELEAAMADLASQATELREDVDRFRS